MQQLSNDTGSWHLIVAPPPSSSSLLYNSNAYDAISPSSATINHPVSLVSPPSITIETTSVNYWAFILIIFPLFTIFGNILVVISVYREKSLHTVTNYFVVSLAISDITVAAVVMPFAIYLEVSRNKIKKKTNKSLTIHALI
jgi:dopamine D2-like receptor